MLERFTDWFNTGDNHIITAAIAIAILGAFVWAVTAQFPTPGAY